MTGHQYKHWWQAQLIVHLSTYIFFVHASSNMLTVITLYDHVRDVKQTHNINIILGYITLYS